jgi:hypothetical protein
MPISKAVEHTGPILEALDAERKKDSAHRAPANILIARQGIKVLDFGLSKHPRGHRGSRNRIVDI